MSGLGRARSAAVVGVSGTPVEIESFVNQGLPAVALVGLADVVVPLPAPAPVVAPEVAPGATAGHRAPAAARRTHVEEVAPDEAAGRPPEGQVCDVVSAERAV